MLLYDEPVPGARFLRSGDGFRPGTDAVLLAAFAARRQGARRIADLGCGAGVVTVLLLQALPHATAVGVELRPEAAALCRENLALNGLEGRATVLTGDLRAREALPEAGRFDLVAANPPYFPAGSGGVSPDARRDAARSERGCTLRDVCAAGSYLLRNGGALALVHRPERLSELFCAMTACGVEPKRLRLVCRTAADAPTLVLVEGRRGGRPGLRVEPPLALRAADGAPSAELRKIYREELET